MYIWYLSYGSNLNRQRFNKYIFGGKVNKDTREEGCRDQSLPIEEKAIRFNYDLYFAGECSKWDNKGMAFIKKSSNQASYTYGKMYLIKQSQFEDVVKQENKMAVSSDLSIDYHHLDRHGYYDLNPTTYGRMLKIGEDKGYPIYTFTSSQERADINPPAITYLTTILSGLLETQGIKVHEVLQRFASYQGIQEATLRHTLKSLMANKDYRLA